MAESKPPTSDVKLGLAEAQLRAQVLQLSTRERAPTRAELARERRIVLAIVLLVPLSIFVASGGIRLGPRPERLVLQTALGSAFLAAGVAIVGIGRGRSMLGRPRWWLVTQVLLTPVLLFGWRVLLSTYYPDMMAEWVDRPGLRCFTLSVVLACAPLLGLLWLRPGELRPASAARPRAPAAAVDRPERTPR
jgi:hypothetical protein